MLIDNDYPLAFISKKMTSGGDLLEEKDGFIT